MEPTIKTCGNNEKTIVEYNKDCTYALYCCGISIEFLSGLIKNYMTKQKRARGI